MLSKAGIHAKRIVSGTSHSLANLTQCKTGLQICKGFEPNSAPNRLNKQKAHATIQFGSVRFLVTKAHIDSIKPLIVSFMVL